MKNISKKGFTLVEMIGIIIILAVILIVTVPILTNTLRNSSQKQYELFLKNLSAATENYIIDEKKVSESEVSVSLGELLTKNYIDEIPSMPIDDPFGIGTTLSEADKVYAKKNSNNVYEYQLCRNETCFTLEEFKNLINGG